jgi:hypothetical protein
VLPVQTHRLLSSQVAFNLTMLAGPSDVPLVDGVYWTRARRGRFQRRGPSGRWPYLYLPPRDDQLI